MQDDQKSDFTVVANMEVKECDLTTTQTCSGCRRLTVRYCANLGPLDLATSELSLPQVLIMLGLMSSKDGPGKTIADCQEKFLSLLGCRTDQDSEPMQ